MVTIILKMGIIMAIIITIITCLDIKPSLVWSKKMALMICFYFWLLEFLSTAK